jgi:RimJ/RimL family protein N-acetyltransferase
MNATSDAAESCAGLVSMTARMLVRLTQEEEADAVLKLLRSRCVSCCFLSPPSPHDAEARAEMVQGSLVWTNKQYVHLTALELQSYPMELRVVGAAHLCEGEIGYCIEPTLWRRGYGYELAEALCRIAREQLRLDKVHAMVLREDLAALRILERLGFEFCGQSSPGFPTLENNVVLTAKVTSSNI